METAELEVFETEDLKKEIDPVVSDANAIVVNSAESYEFAINFLKSVKAAQAKVQEFFSPIKKAAYDTWKKTTAGESQMLTPLEEAERAVKKKAAEYQTAENKSRIEDQRKLQAEADEQARKDRERLEKEAAKLKTPERRESRMAEAAAVAAPVISIAHTVPKVKGVSMPSCRSYRLAEAGA